MLRLLLGFLLAAWLASPAAAQITDKAQTSDPFGLVAASASGAACVYPPSTVASCVKLDYQGYQGVAALLKGTWAGTVVGEISADGGTTWTAVNLISSAGVSASSVTAAGLYNPSTVAGAQLFQVRVSVYTSGTVGVVLRGTSAQARGTPTGGGAPIGGSGTLNNLAKFTPDGTTLGNALLTDDGSNVSLPSGVLKIYGTSLLYSALYTDSSGGFLIRQTTVKPAPPTAALAGAVGNVDNGTHVYCVTFLIGPGETDCSASSSAVTVTDKTVNGQVTVTFTTSGFSGATARNVYRSKAGTTTPLFLVVTSPVVNNNTGLTYTDNIADASLTATTAPLVNTTGATTADARLTIADAGTTTLAGLVGSGTRCVNVSSTGVLGAAAADCVTSVAFSAITAGTNAAALVVGTGGSLTVSGSGTINATTLGGATFAAPGAIGGGTPGTGAFTTLSSTGQHTVALGSAAAPSILFTGTTDGFYSLGSGNVGLSTAGTLRAYWDANHQFLVGSDISLVWNTDGAGSIGAAGGTRPDHVYSKTDINVANGAFVATATTTKIGSVAFASLGTPAVGTMVYCSDCDAPAAGIMATCTSAGTKTGAWAYRVNSTPVWGCIGI